MKKRFLTLFPTALNIELTKDPGMIPYMLYRYYGYDSTFACYKNGEYPSIDKDVNGLKLAFIKKVFHIEFLDSLWFILFNFRKYDIILMSHWVVQHQLICFFFKALKFGKGCTYIKLDADDNIKKTRGLKLWIIEKTLSFIDIVSVETRPLHHYLNNETKCKIEYIPNGFYDGGNRRTVQFPEKENIILTVGRIGTRQKANEVLLEGFRQFALENIDYKLKIVGPIEEGFRHTIDTFYEKNPQLKERVEFIGPVYDKIALHKFYRKAKIFTLTSRWESFGAVYVEAASAGCYIVSSDILPAYDVTDNLKNGLVFPIDDANALNKCLQKASANDAMLEENCLRAQEFTYENFYSPAISKRLDILIGKVCSKWGV